MSLMETLESFRSSDDRHELDVLSAMLFDKVDSLDARTAGSKHRISHNDGTLFDRVRKFVILAAGRGFGEAAALLYTTGSGTDLRWGNWNLSAPTCPLNVFRPAETLSIQIWNLQVNGQDRALANVSSAILMLLVLAFSIGANLWSHHIKKKSAGEEA